MDVTNAPACKPRSAEHQSLSDPLVLNRFITATERLLSWLEALNAPFEAAIENGDDSNVTTAPQRAVCVSRLDHAWLRVTEVSSFPRGDKRPTLATARCCAAKNRSQDCVPYDMNRVVLRSLKEDYINASHMDFISTLGDWCPRYILTQAPLCNTVADFWTMIFEQGCEVVALLLPLRAQTISSISTLPSSVDPISGLAEALKRRLPPSHCLLWKSEYHII
ncbi:unnamed protein product [Schistocephalus solidus]|uniref:Tyrosine-protein phosphatase domain-containing protein n=1 Tax=Schistocephalus solidus TaxID=70667 RepID=A0A183SSF2_SCHSO|nr:unnamed protein product [Schistocephalus solidus]